MTTLEADSLCSAMAARGLALRITLGLVFITAAEPVRCLAAPQAEPLLRIQRLIQQGDLRGARVGLKDALTQFPGDPRVYNLLGVVAAQEGNFVEAELNFRQAIQKAPKFIGAYLNLGRLYQQNYKEGPGVSEKALLVYQTLLRVEPDHVEANYQVAWLLNRLGRFGDSLEYLERLPAPARERPQALALRCANYAALGRAAQAESAGRKLLAHNDLVEIDVLAILPTLITHNAGDLATRLLEDLAQRDGASAESFQHLARLYQNQARLNEARGALEKAAQAGPPSARLVLTLAQLAYQAKDLQGALAYLAHARDLEPGNAAAHFFFGIVCIELNLSRDGMDSLRQAVRLDPNNAYYNYALGALLVQEKDADQAIPYFQKYCEARPDDARGRFALGVAFFYTYALDSARRELRSVAGHSETSSGANLFLGRIALREGDLARAVEHLQQAIQANQSTPDPHAELGLVYIRRKEYVLAQESLAHALRLAPDHYLANLNLLMLYERTKDSRVEAQAKRVEQIRRVGEEKERLLLRALDIRPTDDPAWRGK